MAGHAQERARQTFVWGVLDVFTFLRFSFLFDFQDVVEKRQVCGVAAPTKGS
jgi:hypothetical protein